MVSISLYASSHLFNVIHLENLLIFDKSLSENHMPILFCHFEIQSIMYLNVLHFRAWQQPEVESSNNPFVIFDDYDISANLGKY